VNELEKLALHCMTANEINTFYGIMQKKTIGDFGNGSYKIDSKIKGSPKMQMRLLKVLSAQRFL
jgi:hypothetical protein